MKATRLVACVLVVFGSSTLSWAQLSLNEFSQGKQINKYSGIATAGLGDDMAWASPSPRVSNLSLAGPSKLSLAGVAPTKIVSDEVFSLALESRNAALNSGVVAVSSQQVSMPSAAGVPRSVTATWSSSPVQLLGATQQLVSLGDASESLAPLSLPVSSSESLLKDDRGPAWLPTAGAR